MRLISFDRDAMKLVFQFDDQKVTYDDETGVAEGGTRELRARVYRAHVPAALMEPQERAAEWAKAIGADSWEDVTATLEASTLPEDVPRVY